MRLFAEDVMPVRCAGCAYSEGTEANRDQLTSITRDLCEMGDVNFYCHANAVQDVLPATGKRVCHGYSDAVFARIIRGEETQPWKRRLAVEALRLMEEEQDRAVSGKPMRSPDDTVRELLRRVEAATTGDAVGQRMENPI